MDQGQLNQICQGMSTLTLEQSRNAIGSALENLPQPPQGILPSRTSIVNHHFGHSFNFNFMNPGMYGLNLTGNGLLGSAHDQLSEQQLYQR